MVPKRERKKNQKKETVKRDPAKKETVKKEEGEKVVNSEIGSHLPDNHAGGIPNPQVTNNG